jgi:hypothetical protein
MEIESDVFQTYSDILSDMIQENIDSPDENQIKKIRSYWDGESWELIQSHFQAEGSTWIVWWQDGVANFMASKAI